MHEDLIRRLRERHSDAALAYRSLTGHEGKLVSVFSEAVEALSAAAQELAAARAAAKAALGVVEAARGLRGRCRESSDDWGDDQLANALAAYDAATNGGVQCPQS
jgi:hypothetical protein